MLRTALIALALLLPATAPAQQQKPLDPRITQEIKTLRDEATQREKDTAREVAHLKETVDRQNQHMDQLLAFMGVVCGGEVPEFAEV